MKVLLTLGASEAGAATIQVGVGAESMPGPLVGRCPEEAGGIVADVDRATVAAAILEASSVSTQGDPRRRVKELYGMVASMEAEIELYEAGSEIGVVWTWSGSYLDDSKATRVPGWALRWERRSRARRRQAQVRDCRRQAIRDGGSLLYLDNEEVRWLVRDIENEPDLSGYEWEDGEYVWVGFDRSPRPECPVAIGILSDVDGYRIEALFEAGWVVVPRRFRRRSGAMLYADRVVSAGR